MKISGIGCGGWKVYLDGELFNNPKKVILSADDITGIIEYLFTTDHFPYWPSRTWGKVTLEKING